jgi:hypothetical protein
VRQLLTGHGTAVQGQRRGRLRVIGEAGHESEQLGADDLGTLADDARRVGAVSEAELAVAVPRLERRPAVASSRAADTF